jgi:hypothetical protein
LRVESTIVAMLGVWLPVAILGFLFLTSAVWIPLAYRKVKKKVPNSVKVSIFLGSACLIYWIVKTIVYVVK